YLSYMKYIISERQYKVLTEDKERKILKVPGLEVFGGWEGLQIFLKGMKNPLFSISGDLNLSHSDITSLDNLVSVEGNLVLLRTSVKSLGNLKYVGGYLYLSKSQIQSLGNLEYVGGFLDLGRTPIESLDN
ncbi:MAG: hypothetical protein ACK55I_25800, partial [bacterium]